VLKITPDNLFAYTFLDDKLNAIYKAEDDMGKVFKLFSGLALVIAIVGLVGLVTYTLETKVKEIGIRKVLGSTNTQVVMILSNSYLKMVAIGFVIAVPLIWFIVNKWLSQFAYRIEIQPWVLLVTGIGVLTMTMMIVGFFSSRAASANPAESLKYE
jgi:putative ABC transport system permease protein